MNDVLAKVAERQAPPGWARQVRRFQRLARLVVASGASRQERAVGLLALIVIAGDSPDPRVRDLAERAIRWEARAEW